jgi:hypothetical protein
MQFNQKNPPRRYRVGNVAGFDILDCGSLLLQAEEQVTFVTDGGGEFDVTRKSWGFYATPSLNSRLAQFGLRAVLTYSEKDRRYFVLLVEQGHEVGFRSYLDREGLEIVSWLDSTEVLDSLRKTVAAASKR